MDSLDTILMLFELPFFRPRNPIKRQKYLLLGAYETERFCGGNALPVPFPCAPNDDELRKSSMAIGNAQNTNLHRAQTRFRKAINILSSLSGFFAYSFDSDSGLAMIYHSNVQAHTISR